MSLRRHLDAIFDADRRLRAAEQALFDEGAHGALVALLTAAVDEAQALDDREEGSMRLERLADLCAQVEGPEMADALIAILDDDDPQVRVVAGEALLDVGYERYAEVARAVERALDDGRGGPAMAELPWVLAEIGEPSALSLIGGFTEHEESDVVAAAIEALLHLGEPAAIELLRPLEDDDRIGELDGGDEGDSATIGELAAEAIAGLGG